jgi:hypothetical protein
VCAAQVDFAKGCDGMLLVETEHRHEKAEALDGAVEIRLALKDRSVNVDEERSHLAVSGAEIASGHFAFGGHGGTFLWTHEDVELQPEPRGTVERSNSSSD